MSFASSLRAWWRLARPFTCLPPAVGVLSGSAAALGAVARRNGQSAAEVLAGLDATGAHLDPPRLWSHAVVLGALAAVALNAFSNAINQIADLEIDRRIKPERPLVTGEISRGGAWAFSLGALLAGVTWGLFARPPGATTPEFFFCALGAALLTAAYSLKPVRLKRWGLAANLAIASARGLLLKVAGWSCLFAAFDPFDAEPWAIGAVFFVFTLGAVTTKDFSDAEADAAEGVRSLPVAWGFKSAARFAAVCLVVPWLALPLLGLAGVLNAPLSSLVALAAVLCGYGAWTGWVLARDPDALGTEQNHPAWRHMYILMMLAQIGLAVVYLV